MIQIAIVEDEVRNAQLLQQFVGRYQKENGGEFHTTHFSDGKEFIEQLGQEWKLVLLDIEMPNINGIETAKQIRKVDKEVRIVFVTNISEYILDGYLYDASNYILKPLNYHEFYLKIGKLLELFKKKMNENIVVSNRSQWTKIPLQNILYFESQGHRIIIHTFDGNVESTTAGSLEEYEERLRQKGFYRCYKCYLVNLRNVVDIQEFCVLKDGTQLEIGRGKKKEFRRTLMNYVMGEINGNGTC